MANYRKGLRTCGGDSELVEIKDREDNFTPWYYIYHITFEAKPRGSADDCRQLFFAELYELRGNFGEFVVKICMILDPTGSDVKKGCEIEFGKRHMLHPKGIELSTGPPGWDPNKPNLFTSDVLL